MAFPVPEQVVVDWKIASIVYNQNGSIDVSLNRRALIDGDYVVVGGKQVNIGSADVSALLDSSPQAGVTIRQAIVAAIFDHVSF